MPFGINDEVIEEKPTIFGTNDEVVSTAPVAFGAGDEIVDNTATTTDLINLRRGTPAVQETASPEPLVSPTVTQTTGVMPFDPTSEFAGMEMEQEQVAPTYSFKDLHERDDLFNIIKDYAKARSNIEIKEDQSREEFVADWMQSMREKELNVLLDALPELNYMRNASPQDAAKAALAHKVYQETASVGQKGAQEGFRPYIDTVKAIATDPLNYLGFIFGKGANVAVRGATSELMKKAVTVGTAVGTESLVSGGGDIVDQRIQQEVSKAAGEKVDDINPWRVGAAMILSGATAGVGAGKVATRKTPTEGYLATELKKKAEDAIPQTPTAPMTSLEKKLADPVRDQIDEEVSNFMKREGAKVLEEIGPAGALADSKVATELSQRAVRIALHVIQNDAQFMAKPAQKTSDAIARVFANLDEIDDAVLEQAIRAEGLTPDQFAAANKMTVTDAARVMQQYSVASRLMKKLRGVDPEFNKKMEDLYGKEDEHISLFARGMEAIRSIERESKAWITSGVDTTVRNVAGTAIGLTVKSGANLMEGLIYATGVTVKDAVQGKGVSRGKKAVADSFKDAANTFMYMKKNGLAAEVTDALLQHSPSLRNNMLSALQETSGKDISKVGRMFNTLNMAQDVFFRRAVFAASVETQLRRQGIDMYTDILAKNKLVPSAILSRAVDDALKSSFSYMPKPGKESLKGFESSFETGANRIVSLIEKAPGMSLAIPFPRFMANAMAFQYRYSPLGFAGALEDMSRAVGHMRAGNTERATELFRQGNMKSTQALIGTASVFAAYEYRLNNLDTEWYNVKSDDGSTMDIRAVFPLAPYFAIADIMARNKQGVPAKTGDAFQAVVGMKMPAGSQNVLVDQIIAAASTDKEADALAISLGKLLGDFAGRFTQPFVIKNFYDMYDLLNQEGSIARDPNVIDTSGSSFEQGAQAAVQRVQAKIPVLKEELPEAIPRLREGPVVREGQFFNRLVGFRKDPTKNPIEREVAKLNLEPYRLYGSPSGDKEYDRLYTEEANKQVMARVSGVLKNSSYQARSPLEQRTALVGVIRESAARAKKIVEGQYKAADIKRVYRNKFNKLPQERRMLINQYYARDHDGVTLEEAEDYTAIDQYENEIKTLRYALGGIVSKTAIKGLTASGKKTSKQLMEEMQQKAAKIADDTPVAKVVDEPLAPMVEEVAPKTGLVKYAPEEVQMAETKAMEFEGASTMDWLKQNYPEKYENTIFTYMGKEVDDEPFPGSGSIYDFIDEEGNYDFTKTVAQKEAEAPPTVKGLMQPVAEEPVVIVSDKAVKGSLKTVRNLADRNDMIEQIREIRTERFPKLKVEGVEDSVIGVTQGDFRMLNGREADPTKAKDRSLFKDLAKKKQKELDRLRTKYKDTPPIEIFHGNPKRAEDLSKEGFAKPQRSSFAHSELNIAGPSFTKDLNLQFNTGSFGGQDPSAIVSTKMPYADYLFSRVNMPSQAYDAKDLDVIARAVSGDPASTRPLSLPRSGALNETEDTFIEADKLLINKADKSVSGKLKDYAPIAEKRAAALEKYKDMAAIAYDTKRFNSLPEKDQAIAANNTYKAVRELFNSYAEAAKITSTKTGMGQQYTALVAGSPMYPVALKNVAGVLEKQGSVERAKLLRKIADNLDEIRKADDRVPATRAIQETAAKLAKGGLAKRR